MRRVLFLVILAGIILSPLTALEGVEGQLGWVWYGNGEDQPETPSPLVASVGLAMPFPLGEHLVFYPDLGFSVIDYYWRADEARAVPAEIATSDRMTVLHLLFNPSLVYLFDLNSRISLGGRFAPSFLFRIPLYGHDQGEETRDELVSYFYGQGRFFYPSLGPELRWRYSEKVVCRIYIQLLWPLHNAWDGEAVPVWDQMMITGGLGLLVRL